jgi:DNA methylase
MGKRSNANRAGNRGRSSSSRYPATKNRATSKSTKSSPAWRRLERLVGRNCSVTLYLADCHDLLPMFQGDDAVVRNGFTSTTAQIITSTKEKSHEQQTAGRKRETSEVGSGHVGQAERRDCLAIPRAAMVSATSSGILRGDSSGNSKGNEETLYQFQDEVELRDAEWALQRRIAKYVIPATDQERQVLEMWRSRKIGDSSSQRKTSGQSFGKPASALRELPQQLSSTPLVGCSQISIVTDPPYGTNWCTDSTRFSGGVSKNVRQKRGDGRDDWGKIEGDATPFDPSPWLNFSRVVLWGANHYAARLPVGTTLVWIKKDDRLFGTFLSDAEIGWMKTGHGVYCFRKTFAPPTRAKEARGTTVYLSPAHPTQKPVALMSWCLRRAKVLAGETVLDPFMGSGTTGVACMRRRCHFIGVEKDERYFEIALKRIRGEISRQRRMF